MEEEEEGHHLTSDFWVGLPCYAAGTAGDFGCWGTKVIWLLVLEHCTGGDLFDYVRVSWPSAAPEKKKSSADFIAHVDE